MRGQYIKITEVVNRNFLPELRLFCHLLHSSDGLIQLCHFPAGDTMQFVTTLAAIATFAQSLLGLHPVPKQVFVDAVPTPTPLATVAPVQKKSANIESGAKPSIHQTAPAPAGVSGSGVWDRLAQCESGGRWNANTGNGYYGGLQFNLSTFQSNGGSGNPANASREEQIRVAENIRSKRGFSPWPACARKLGLL